MYLKKKKELGNNAGFSLRIEIWQNIECAKAIRGPGLVANVCYSNSMEGVMGLLFLLTEAQTC